MKITYGEKGVATFIVIQFPPDWIIFTRSKACHSITTTISPLFAKADVLKLDNEDSVIQIQENHFVFQFLSEFIILDKESNPLCLFY
jgi:hypothetical protein